MKQVKLLTLTIGFTMMLSCAEEKPDIPPKKMKALLYEIHIAEALAQHLPKDSLQLTLKNTDSLKQFTADILLRYKITDKMLQESMDYYKKHPVLLDSIYTEMLSEIAVEQARLK